MLLTRSLSLALAGLSISLLLPGQSPASLRTDLAALYLEAWFPEARTVPLRTTEDRTLSEAMRLAGQGRLVEAEHAVEAIAKATHDPVVFRGVLLVQDRIRFLRNALLGGGGEFNSYFSFLPMQTNEALTLSPAPGQLSDSSRDEASDEILVGLSVGLPQCFDVTTQQIQHEMAVRVGGRAQDDPFCQSVEEALDKFAARSTQHRVQAKLFRELMRGRIAQARGDFDEARFHFQNGMQFAKDQRMPKAVVRFTLFIGDVDAAPFGNTLTLGYQLSSEQNVRFALLSGTWPRTAQPPTEEMIERARQSYAAARAAWTLVPDADLKYQITAREAYVSLFTKQSPASKLLDQAASEARNAGWLRDAAVLDAARAVLSVDSDLYLKALSTLRLQQDWGGIASLVSLAHSYAVRLQMTGDPLGAVARLRMAIDTLDDSDRTKARDHPNDDVSLRFGGLEPRDTLANAFSASGRWEAGNGELQNLLTLRAEFASVVRSRIVQDLKAGAWTRSPSPAEGLLDAVYNAQLRNLSELAVRLRSTITEERGPVVRPQIDELETTFRALASKDLYPQHRIDSYEVAKAQVEWSSKLTTARSTYRTCTGFSEAIRKLAPQAKNIGESLQLDNAGNDCGTEFQESARKELAALDVVFDLKHAIINRNQASQDPQKAAEWQAVVDQSLGTLSAYFDYAAVFSASAAFEKTLDQFDALVRAEPSLTMFGDWLQYYQAILFKQKQKSDEATRIIEKLLAGPSGPNLRPVALDRLLREIVDLESLRGNGEASLVAQEQLWAVEDVTRRSRSGLQPGKPDSAELAKLDEMAGRNQLPAELLARRRVLHDSQLRDSTTGENPPSAAEVHATLAALPRRTTALVYSQVRGSTILWRVRAGEPVFVKRIDVSNFDLAKWTVELSTRLSKPVEGWADPAHKLYGALIEPAGPIPDGDLVVIVGAGALGSIPFEVLGPDENRLLLGKHSTAYAGRIGKITVRATRPVSTGAVIVGLNSQGLEDAEPEAQEIASILKVKPILGTAGNLETIAKQAKNARWIHLATHAFLDPVNPYLSYLALADNDRLEGWELFGDTAQAELVVLSACDTQHPQTGAGLFGDAGSLAAFAHMGGARWVVASIWRAYGPSSLDLMKRFYGYAQGMPNAQGMPIAQALQRAKLDLAGKDLPHYYANFVLSASTLAEAIAP